MTKVNPHHYNKWRHRGLHLQTTYGGDVGWQNYTSEERQEHKVTLELSSIFHGPIRFLGLQARNQEKTYCVQWGSRRGEALEMHWQLQS